MCSLFSVFTFFYLILENMSTNVRKFPFSLLYLTLVTSCTVGPFLCCHLLYFIIYLAKSIFEKRMYKDVFGTNLLHSSLMTFYKISRMHSLKKKLSKFLYFWTDLADAFVGEKSLSPDEYRNSTITRKLLNRKTTL